MNPGRCKYRHKDEGLMKMAMNRKVEAIQLYIWSFRLHELNLFNTVLVQNMLLVTSIINSRTLLCIVLYIHAAEDVDFS